MALRYYVKAKQVSDSKLDTYNPDNALVYCALGKLDNITYNLNLRVFILSHA